VSASAAPGTAAHIAASGGTSASKIRPVHTAWIGGGSTHRSAWICRPS